MEIDGTKIGGPLPHPLGHEGCGIVEEVGPAVRGVKKGQKVCMHWRKGDGIECEHPELFISDLGKIVTAGKVTSFSEYSVCSENRLTPLPDDTPIELGALLGCSLSTALGTIESEANLKMGESVLIIGCGGLGLNLILAAKMRQAAAIDVLEKQLEKEYAATCAGANWFFSSSLPETFFYDVVIDTTGNESAISEGLRHIGQSGRFIMVGQPRGNVTIERAVHMFEGEGKTIKATQGGMFKPSQDIPRYVKLHQAGLLKLDGIVSHRVSFDEINKGIDLVRNGHAGRVMIIP